MNHNVIEIEGIKYEAVKTRKVPCDDCVASRNEWLCERLRLYGGCEPWHRTDKQLVIYKVRSEIEVKNV